MKRFCIFVAWTITDSENVGLHKLNALCTRHVALKKEIPDSLEKNWPDFSNVASRFFYVC